MDTDSMIEISLECALHNQAIKDSTTVVITAGVPIRYSWRYQSD